MTPDDADFRAAAARAADWIAGYRERVGDLPVLAPVRPGEIAARIRESPPEEPDRWEELFEDLDRVILPGVTHWNHPGFLAYFPSSSSPPGIVAEFLAAALNQNAMLWRTSPAATELEERMVGWIRRFVRLPGSFSGVLQDTASSSSFLALLAARTRAVPGVRDRGLAGRPDTGPLAIYLSDQAHSSLDKAALAAGLGLGDIRRLESDDAFRMRPEDLARRIDEDRAEGRIPVMVCATIGTTSNTAVDPVGAIAEVCADHDVWLHVDAAYAGPAAALPECTPHFLGWERADSIVINPHKWMMTPIDCSVLLFRDPAAIRAPLALTPAYLRAEDEADNLMDYGLPLGRRFRALKLWFIFRRYGAAGIRRKLRHDIALAREFASWLEHSPDFQVLGKIPFGTVCFRADPARSWIADATGSGGRYQPGPAADEWNRRLLQAVNRRGPVFLSHTVLRGRYTLRLAVGGAASDEEAVRAAYDLLRQEQARMIKKEERT